MKKIQAILKNELKLYGYSWLGWTSFLLINLIAGLGYLFGSVSYGNFQYFFSLLEMPFAWAILIVGSRSLAKDKELGMFSLYFTSPISLNKILLAKFLALTLFFMMIALSLLFYVFLSTMFFNISWMTVFSGMIGLFCVILIFSSISVFASSCADNTLISIVIGFGLWMFVYLIGSLGNAMDPNLVITKILQQISYSYHFKNINSGVFTLGDILYFLIFYIVTLNLTESKILKQVAY